MINQLSGAAADLWESEGLAKVRTIRSARRDARPRRQDGPAKSRHPGHRHPHRLPEGRAPKRRQPVEMPDPGDRMGLRSLAIPSIDTLIGYLKAAHLDERLPRDLVGDRLAEVPETYRRSCGPGSPPPDHPQEQPPRPDRLPPRPARPELGPAGRHRHDPTDRIVTRTHYPLANKGATCARQQRGAVSQTSLRDLEDVCRVRFRQ